MQNFNDTTVEVRRRKEVPYFQVDNNIMDYDIFSDIYEKLAYIALCRLASQKDHAFPSNKTLAKICYCGETKIKEVLKGLETKGFIEVERERFDSKGGQLPNLIYINDIPDNLVTEDRYFYKKKNTPSRVATPPQSCGDTPPSRVATPRGSCGDTEKEQYKKNNNKKKYINNNKERNLALVHNGVSSQENEKDVVVELLSKYGLEVNKTTLKKWRGLALNDEIITDAIKKTVIRDEIENVIGYVTRMLETGYTPNFKKKVSKESVLPEWVSTQEQKKNNQTSVSSSELTKEQQEEALRLLKALGEIG